MSNKEKGIAPAGYEGNGTTSAERSTAVAVAPHARKSSLISGDWIKLASLVAEVNCKG
jgi:hypothetical protein